MNRTPVSLEQISGFGVICVVEMIDSMYIGYPSYLYIYIYLYIVIIYLI